MPRVVHFEIPVDDPDRARDFYRTAFDWKFQGYGDSPYWLAEAGAEDEWGVDGALIGRSQLHAAPVVILGVDSVDEGVRRAVAAGAEQLGEKQAVPGMGWAAYVRDPEGNVIGLWQPDESAA